MAAVIQICRQTGAGPSETDITSANTRLKQADNGTTDANNPIPATGTFNATPGSGSAAVSCWAVTRLKLGGTAPSNAISNTKWYSDGANSQGTGVNTKGNSATGYVQSPTTNLTQGAAGELRSANYATLSAEVVDVFTFTSGSPKQIDAGTVFTSGSSLNTSGGNRFVFQMIVDSTASPGTTTQETATWQYDET